MNTSERESIIRKFKNANNSIISNARCLTEGVDVPAVDMVCFMSPKKSEVDIVQAVGRAMRTSEGKEFGYILIPLYLEREMGESIEDALARTDFSEVWNVINALKEHDEVLNDTISQMRMDKGRRKGFDDSRFREKVEILSAEINLETLRRNITAELVDRIGESWDEMYGQLVAYKEEFGNCNVKVNSRYYPKLGQWVSNQRMLGRKGNLLIARSQKLDQIGFSWDRIEGYWQEMMHDLLFFRRQNGHCKVPLHYPNNPKLGGWVHTVRQRKEKLSQIKIDKLNSIGFRI